LKKPVRAEMIRAAIRLVIFIRESKLLYRTPKDEDDPDPLLY